MDPQYKIDGRVVGVARPPIGEKFGKGRVGAYVYIQV